MCKLSTVILKWVFNFFIKAPHPRERRSSRRHQDVMCRTNRNREYLASQSPSSLPRRSRSFSGRCPVVVEDANRRASRLKRSNTLTTPPAWQNDGASRWYCSAYSFPFLLEKKRLRRKGKERVNLEEFSEIKTSGLLCGGRRDLSKSLRLDKLVPFKGSLFGARRHFQHKIEKQATSVLSHGVELRINQSKHTTTVVVPSAKPNGKVCPPTCPASETVAHRPGSGSFRSPDWPRLQMF